ncbi:MFS transporter [Ralstonia sp. SET104]|uniref:MFS transporter n=1 Tax=Ralstonia sp. SET104 TaxID=2448774 RepID=UPI000F56FFEE|nr:MFS transporter [Ralstonia sp. SET104]GCB06037.1 MFS transporter [Ralstonia sp. SET104]
MPASLWWLCLGAFAIGTEGFMIAGLLPVLAADLGVSVPAAGQLVTVFAVTYAVGSPVMAALLGNVDRRRVLIGALAIFACGNLVAASAHGFGQLMAARVLLALAAGVFLPTANAVATSLAPPARSGTALAIITGGGTVAVALGVPLGAWIAAQGDWRSTFVACGVLSALATAGLAFGLPRALPHSVTTLAQRLSVARRPGMPGALAVSALWAAGGFTFYTYVAPFFVQGLGFAPQHVGIVLFLVGSFAALGTGLGGRMTDRAGVARVLAVSSAGIVLAFSVLSLSAQVLHRTTSGAVAGAIAIGAVVLWGMAGWGFGPAQATRLIRLAPDVSPITLSLHASAVYAGIALGSSVGALALAHGGPGMLGWAAAACHVVAVVLWRSGGRHAPVEADEPAATSVAH